MFAKTKCEADVEFASLPNYGTRIFHTTCPCFKPTSGCDKAEYPTPAEVAESEKELDTKVLQIITAREYIVAAIGPYVRGSCESGRLDCPICRQANTLVFSRSGYNGHVHAKCDTKDCVAWME